MYCSRFNVLRKTKLAYSMHFLLGITFLRFTSFNLLFGKYRLSTFSLNRICASRQRDTYSDGWKFNVNNLMFKELVILRVYGFKPLFIIISIMPNTIYSKINLKFQIVYCSNWLI